MALSDALTGLAPYGVPKRNYDGFSAKASASSPWPRNGSRVLGYLGRHVKGGSVVLGIQCTDEDGVPTMPSAAPTATIYDDAGSTVSTVTMPIHNRYKFDTAGTTGAFFMIRERLSADYDPGRHMVLFSYTVLGISHLRRAVFDILTTNSGSDAGTILGVTRYDTPNGTNVVLANESGELKSGLNPR